MANTPIKKIESKDYKNEHTNKIEHDKSIKEKTNTNHYHKL